MIVVRILGGLGNQMFQYALGRRLSLERDEALRLDVSGFESDPLRTLTLDHFALEFELALGKDVRALTHVPPRFPETVVPRKWIPKPLRNRKRLNPHHVKEVEGFRFDPEVLRTPSPAYFDGYWQSERYFDTIADTLRADFAFRAPLTERNAEVAAEIAEGQAVSLHVRRGDYANHARTNEVHGLCSLEYYADAVARLSAELHAPRFFVFSDEPAWCGENLDLPGEPVFVDHNGEGADYEDLRLISLCRHHVLANSSFSWWGAWLNPRPDKIVIAPRRWMADPRWACPDICPPEWTRL